MNDEPLEATLSTETPEPTLSEAQAEQAAAEVLAKHSLFKKPPKDPATRNKRLLFDFLVLTIAGVLIYFFAPNPIYLTSDVVRNWMSKPSNNVEQLVLNLRLTEKGKFIFGAVDPQIENRDVFNSTCKTSEESASSLGCYDPTAQKIHIYLVESEELSGEVEATAAHELLHAAWDRLSTYDRNRLESLLMEVYNSPEHHAELAKSTESYGPMNFMTELHSQVAERIKDLPEALEKHYARYFEDQDLVVSYYEKYSSVFDELLKNAEALSAEIEAGRESLNKQASEYETWLNDYNSRVEKFNSCAEDPDCSLVNFETQVANFIAESKKLDDAYAAYETALNALNAKIDDYNSNVLHLQTLDRALNSRSAPETKVETKEK